jgi:hypothetical protein
MSDQESSFTIKDKRRFAPEGAAEEEPRPAPEPEPEPEKPRSQDGQEVPLPEVTFSALVFSLSSSALLHLGLAADPATGQVVVDLPLAKQTIDLLGLLQVKTRGNLDEDETKLLENILYDLRLAYVQVVTQPGQKK